MFCCSPFLKCETLKSLTNFVISDEGWEVFTLTLSLKPTFKCVPVEYGNILVTYKEYITMEGENMLNFIKVKFVVRGRAQTQGSGSQPTGSAMYHPGIGRQ